MKALKEVYQAIEAKKTRGAWAAGVKVYALEIIEDMQERAEYEGHEPETMTEVIDYMLNGAKDYQHPGDLFKAWKVYSWGGSSLIYNGDIAKRLCNNTELRKTDNGAKNPNSREEWLDVQARALFQAGELIKNTIRA